MRCLLIEPFPESALNEQAGKMLLENYDEYARHARSANFDSSTSCLMPYNNVIIKRKQTWLHKTITPSNLTTSIFGMYHD